MFWWLDFWGSSSYWLIFPLLGQALNDLKLRIKQKKTPTVARRSFFWFYRLNAGVAYASWTLTAFKPFLPCWVSNVTESPSRTLSTKPLTWTKISSPEFESTTKPKPLVSLKNLTVPDNILKKLKKWKVIVPKDRAKVILFVENTWVLFFYFERRFEFFKKPKNLSITPWASLLVYTAVPPPFDE